MRFDLGYRKAGRGDPDGATREFERSIALWPNAGAWMNIGALRERAGEFGAALAAYDEA